MAVDLSKMTTGNLIQEFRHKRATYLRLDNLDTERARKIYERIRALSKEINDRYNMLQEFKRKTGNY
jgi:hypothetical protein